MKTLIITNSFDVTTDLLIEQIGTENIFRLNFDLLDDYSILINDFSFKINSPIKEISENEISKVYWRKPFSVSNKLSEYEYQEKKQIVRGIFNILFVQGKAIITNPYKDFAIGKLLQLRVAKNYFNVPKWELILNHKSSFSKCVAKSLSSTVIDDNKIFFTTIVETDQLDLKEPWHLQEYLDKKKDITVVYIYGEIFAFELDNSSGQVDWRKNQLKTGNSWNPHILNSNLSKSVLGFMKKMNLCYGRLDFILYEEQYFFLEVNINGQWAFLDLNNCNGLLTTMSKYIHPLSSCTFLS